VFAILGHLSSAQSQNPRNSAASGCDCGASIAEAISMGCKFDSLAAAWLPAHCRDDELTAEFQTVGDGPDGNWIYYADVNHTSTLTLDEVAALADIPSATVHMGPTHHKMHCRFYWRKQYRVKSKNDGRIVEPNFDNEGHIKHCGRTLLRKGYSATSPILLNTNSRSGRSTGMK
jgi:hypothetical protein